MIGFAPAIAQSAYLFQRRTLGVALEPLDAHRRLRVASGLVVALDVAPGTPLPAPPPDATDGRADGLVRFERNSLSIFCLPSPKVRPAPVLLRLGGDDRRFVPRRLRLEAAPGPNLPAPLWLRPSLLAGATYDVPPRATLIRGTLTYLADGARVRWARVHVQDVASGAWLGVAHGDDRGEFLFVLPAHAAYNGPLPTSELLTLRLSVHARPANPAPNAATASDAWWDLPVETVTLSTMGPFPRQPEPVALAGDVDPAGLTSVTDFTQQVALSRSTSLELAV